MTFGLQCDEPTSVAILDRAADGGVTFLDTADVYPLGGSLDTVGRTEEILGRWLDGPAPRVRGGHQVLRRDERAAVGPRALAQAHPRRHRGLAAPPAHRLRGSLPVPSPRPRDAHRRDAARARRRGAGGQGRATSAARTFPAYQIARAIGRSEALGVARFDSVQPRYNLLFRQIERELLPLCREEGIGVIPYNPLAGRVPHRASIGGEARPDARHPLHPRAARRAAIRIGTGTSASSRPWRRCARSPPRRACR